MKIIPFKISLNYITLQHGNNQSHITPLLTLEKTPFCLERGSDYVGIFFIRQSVEGYFLHMEA